MSEDKKKGIQINVQKWPWGGEATMFQEATYHLTGWFLGAARAELRHSGSEADVASPNVVHRVSAIFFAAAALESHLNRMAEDLVTARTASACAITPATSDPYSRT